MLGLMWQLTATAEAGTYPMYQCQAPTSGLAPGWSVYGFTTLASTVLTNTCANPGGTIGGYVFSNGQPGAVTENGSSGSQVGLALTVPPADAGVTIQSITATAVVSPVTGDDAFLGFASAGQSLPGAVELPYGASGGYTSTEHWSLPGGARDFEMFVNCSTDRSSPTCQFSDSTHVPGLRDITAVLAESTPPTIANVSGSLAASAAAGTTVSGSRTLDFDASDADSGVRSAALTFTPESGASPHTTSIDYGSECTYDAWSECPQKESGSSFTVDVASLPEDTYAVRLSVTDAAGNTASDYLGTIATKTVPHIPNGFPCSAPQITLTTGKKNVRRVRYGQPFVIHGWLHCGKTPIPSATLKLSGTRIAGLLRTSPLGSFSYLVPTGPSRTLIFSYFAYSDAMRPASEARMRVGVYPAISLEITPKRTANGRTILWRGRVRGGPYPRGGLTLLVQVHSGRRWETFDQLLTHNGAFEYRYTFLRTTSPTIYAFRVALPASGASGYDYLPSSSHAVRVRVAA